MQVQDKFDMKKDGTTKKCPGGYRILTSSLDTMALAHLVLKKGGIREPHWHPNADELAYCVEGKALITIFGPNNTRDVFTCSTGEAVFFPKGYIHHIENIHSQKSSFVLAYDHPTPEDIDISTCIGSMKEHVLASTFSSPETIFKKLKKSAEDTFISLRKTDKKSENILNSHKINLEHLSPQIETPGGLARIANDKNFPVLKHLALFSLRIKKRGIREPHWHPNATELNLVITGKARLTILSPHGHISTFTLNAGQGSVIPMGYFHHIENIGKGGLHMTVYFNHSNPEDIGLSGAFSAYSKDVLASIFSVDPKVLSPMHTFQENRMILKN